MLTCDFRDDHDHVTDTPTGKACGKPATHRIEWNDDSKRYSNACDDHLKIDETASVKPARIRPLVIATGDVLTDAQVRDALERHIITADLAVRTGAKLSGGQWYAPSEVKDAARAEVTAILNARTVRIIKGAP